MNISWLSRHFVGQQQGSRSCVSSLLYFVEFEAEVEVGDDTGVDVGAETETEVEIEDRVEME